MRIGHRTGVFLWIVWLGAVLTGPGAWGVSIQNLTLTPNPSGRVPLSAALTFKTDVSSQASLTISDGTHTSTIVQDERYLTIHDLKVLGLRPDRRHTITVTVTDENGGTDSQRVEMATHPLPDNFPPLEVTVSKEAKMERGVTMIPFFRWGAGGPESDFGLVIAVDAAGDVVWYYEADHPIGDMVRNLDGNFIYQQGRNGVMHEVDVLGNPVRRWHSTGVPKDVPETSIPVEADTFHHDQVQMPSGNYLMLSTEVRRLENYPSSESDPDAPTKSADVIGDVLIEFQPDGKVVRSWKIMDILDPDRIGYGSLGTGFYAQAYKDVLDKPAKDWTHTNSVFYVAEEDAAILSSYNQDVVYKIDLKTGDLVWLLGNHGGWKKPWRKYLLKPPQDDFMWNYHQHAVKWTPQGTVLMYDNGTHRARPFDKKRPPEEVYSRAVEFRIDEEAMEIEKVWQYGGPEDEIFFSSFICDVDWLPEKGNLLVTDGARRTGGRLWARVFEVTHTQPAEKVFEIVIDDPDMGWAVYRSQRLHSLYPSLDTK